MQVAILAGGLGTRLMPLTRDVPKSMVPVLGRPFLEHQLSLLQSHGVSDVVLLVGHMADAIRARFGDGKRFGLNILYSDEGEARLDTAGAVKHAERLLDDAFMVLFGDSYLPIDYAQVWRDFSARNTLGMMTVYRNDNQFDTSDVAVDDGLVTAYQKYPPLPQAVYINYGLTLLKRQVLALIEPNKAVSLQQFLQPIVRQRQLAAWETSHRFFEIGSFEGLKDLEAHLSQSGSRGA